MAFDLLNAVWRARGTLDGHVFDPFEKLVLARVADVTTGKPPNGGPDLRDGLLSTRMAARECALSLAGASGILRRLERDVRVLIVTRHGRGTAASRYRIDLSRLVYHPTVDRLRSTPLNAEADGQDGTCVQPGAASVQPGTASVQPGWTIPEYSGNSVKPTGAVAPAQAHGDIWKAVLESLEVKRFEKETWFRRITLVSDQSDEIVLSVDDPSVARYVARHYLEKLTKALAAVGRPNAALRYVIRRQADAAVGETRHTAARRASA